MQLVGLALGLAMLAASALATAVTTPALLVSLALRRWRTAAWLAACWLASLPGTVFVAASARVYGDPAWRDAPPLAAAYEGEHAVLELRDDGTFRAALDGSSFDGTWTSRPAAGFGHTARTLALSRPDELTAIQRWDGQLALDGRLLQARP